MASTATTKARFFHQNVSVKNPDPADLGVVGDADGALGVVGHRRDGAWTDF